MKHYVVDFGLIDDFQVPESARRASGGSGSWTRWMNDSWTNASPPEDLARPPVLEWTEQHRVQIERAYANAWNATLEDGERFVVTWPPEATLWRPGDAYTLEREACSVHDSDEVDDCLECRELERAAEVIEPAEWHWHVVVEKYSGFGGESEFLEDTNEFFFLRTEVDPREVRYSEWPADR